MTLILTIGNAKQIQTQMIKANVPMAVLNVKICLFVQDVKLAFIIQEPCAMLVQLLVLTVLTFKFAIMIINSKKNQLNNVQLVLI